MRDYGKIYSSFWSSETIRKVSDDGRLLALYLLSCSHSTIAGVFRLPDGYVCEDMQWTAERVKEGFVELLNNGFCNRCETTKWVFICEHFEWNKPENPNQWKSANKLAAQVPESCSWLVEFQEVFVAAGGTIEQPKANPSGTLGEPLPNQKQKQKQKQKKEGAALPLCTLSVFMENKKQAGEKIIPANHAVYEYAKTAGIPSEFLSLAWAEFKSRYTTAPDDKKKYQDWPAVFHKAVKGNWLKVWFIEGGAYKLTTTGQQADLARAAHARH